MLTPKPGAMLRGHDAVTRRADLATGVTVPMVAFIVVVAGVIAAHGPAGRVSATFMAGAGDGFAWGSVPVGLATMALIVVLRRAAPRWPGLILALALGSGLAALLPEMGGCSRAGSVRCLTGCHGRHCPISRQGGFGNSCPLRS